MPDTFYLVRANGTTGALTLRFPPQTSESGHEPNGGKGEARRAPEGVAFALVIGLVDLALALGKSAADCISHSIYTLTFSSRSDILAEIAKTLLSSITSSERFSRHAPSFVHPNNRKIPRNADLVSCLSNVHK